MCEIVFGLLGQFKREGKTFKNKFGYYNLPSIKKFK